MSAPWWRPLPLVLACIGWLLATAIAIGQWCWRRRCCGGNKGTADLAKKGVELGEDGEEGPPRPLLLHCSPLPPLLVEEGGKIKNLIGKFKKNKNGMSFTEFVFCRKWAGREFHKAGSATSTKSTGFGRGGDAQPGPASFWPHLAQEQHKKSSESSGHRLCELQAGIVPIHVQKTENIGKIKKCTKFGKFGHSQLLICLLIQSLSQKATHFH